MDLNEHSQAYQAYLEGVRAHPEDEELQLEFERAKKELEVAYLEYNLKYGR